MKVQRDVRRDILSKMDVAIAEMKSDGRYERRKRAITGMLLDRIMFNYGDNTYYDNNTQELTVLEFDISRNFEKAGKILGEGLHTEYWIKHSDRVDHTEVQTEVIVLASSADFMEQIEKYAKDQFLSLYDANKRKIARLPEARKAAYSRMVNASAEPVEIPWVLQIPYEVDGVTTPMYPDLIIVRADRRGYVFDILEPHDGNRKDNCQKAIGLAKFAEKHWDKYGRIQLIRKKGGPDGKNHFYRLDMSKTAINQKVRGITTNAELDRIFDENVQREDF